ncbi:hypothetical protein [Methylorubrum thiocyanatum]
MSITTAEGGQEEVVLSKRLLKDGAMDVGAPLNIREGQYLIELPRESASGRWRVWIPASEVVSDKALQPA